MSSYDLDREKGDASMDIKIRNLEPDIVARLSGLAEQAGQSRNEFLRTHFDRLANADKVRQVEDQYSQLIEFVLEVVQQNTEALKEFIAVERGGKNAGT
jgi:dTDP-4-dehydrorhamnose reductase